MLDRVNRYAPVALTLLLIGYVAAFARLEVVTTGAQAFRERSKAAMLEIPRRVGDWLAESHDIDKRARDLLQANAGFSFRYTDSRRQSAIYTVVQVTDAQLMSGHAPMNCYRGNGWTIRSVTPKVWRLGSGADAIEIKGNEYRLHMRAPSGQELHWNLRHFFIFPDGTIDPTLEAVDRAAEDYGKVAYGIAQVQFITHDAMPEAARERAFVELVGSEKSLAMFRILRTGIPR